MRLGKALAVGVVQETGQQSSTETSTEPSTASIPRVTEAAERPTAGVHARRDSEPSARPPASGRGEPVAAPPSR